MLVAGGACSTSTPNVQSIVVGSAAATISCDPQGQTDYSEMYNVFGWAIGPPPAVGYTPANAPASAVLL